MSSKVLLNSGNSIPILGLGTWKSKPGEVRAAVECAIDAGYRHIDCAKAYENENEVGEAIQNKIKEGKIKREDLFVTSKLWNIDHHPDHVRPGILGTLKNLKLEYLDLYLIHWPIGLQHDKGMFPKHPDGKLMYSEEDDYLNTWKAMEKLQQEGLAKNIGVSNFNTYQLQRILDNGSIPPSNNQVESHPYLLNEELFQFCKSKGISFTAYSPLGSADRPWAKSDEPKLLEDPKVLEIANRLGKSSAQVLIRFQIQRGIIVIPKSVTPSRIQSNFNVFDFELTEDDMTALKSFKINFRGCALEWCSDHKYFPFRENYTE